jgi:hypothetical protein
MHGRLLQNLWLGKCDGSSTVSVVLVAAGACQPSAAVIAVGTDTHWLVAGVQAIEAGHQE